MMLGLAAALATNGTAQVRPIDPNQGIDSDLRGPQQTPAERPASDLPPPAPQSPDTTAQSGNVAAGATDGNQAASTDRAATSQAATTYQRKDLISAGEGVFGKGAEGLAGIIEKILREQGEPNAYIAGREASGAFVLGARYGSGLMSHKIEGDRPVYWTGPSVGFDLGGNASKVFVLVYNLYDTEDIFRRYPEGEGHLYFVGGFSATYLRRGNIVLIPIRLGVGLRAGINIGYMKFSKKAKWLPL